jgi:hypothetical protein
MEIVRTPTGKPLTAIITSRNLLGCNTHFFKGRTLPCETPTCEACLQGSPWRWHAYLACWNPATGEHFLFETTAAASEAFAAYRSRYGTLRGCKFRASRSTTSKTGRIKIECVPADLARTTIPEEPDLIRVLSVLWNLPTSQMSRRQPPYSDPEIQVKTPQALAEEFAAIAARSNGPSASAPLPHRSNGDQ